MRMHGFIHVLSYVFFFVYLDTNRVAELPRVDLFVTTADPILEPPIITANTVLSLLALDYPSTKLACYVSDDGCSPLTFYALLQASKFAKFWIPFCKKHNVQVRAPFRYFSNHATTLTEQDSPEFKQEWSRMKVILENKDVFSDELPNLIYISREKKPHHPHNYKAGAMNVLTRVSGLMTNAPFMLNVDCDMVVNNPKFVLHAMCILMDSKCGKEVAFVQCFQQFYDGIKDDPFGNQWVVAYEELIKSAAHPLEGKANFANDMSPSNFIEAAIEVAGCGYEYSTLWGKKGLGLWIPIALVVIYNVHTLLEYLTIGLSVRHWWNNQRMTIITTSTAWFIGFLSAMLKLLGISDTLFEITEKEVATSCADGNNADAGRFSFDESPVFVAIMANSEQYLPLYEKFWLKRTFQRVIDTFILLLLLSLLSYRFFSPNTFTFPWLLAFICESWTFTWIVILNAKWSPAVTKTHPDRVLQRVDELPHVDLFVTTADDILEPPILTVNTVLSLLALQYPPNKLACYVSDDGCSPLTFYALLQASKFAKLWVPFCKKYNVQLRAPFRYFSEVATNTTEEDSLEFKQEWLLMKDMYYSLSQKIQEVTHETYPFQLDAEFAVFKNTDRRNHPTIIKVILENKDGLFDGLPHLIYISREKRPQYYHNYKAGAMNVLTRVSGLMTNAPFMLNVDCDMVVHNPKIVLHALCILMDSKCGKEVAFVQCFQQFYDGIKDDPFGNQWVAAFQFGSSKEFVKSVAPASEGSAYSANDVTPSNWIAAATQVANCGYEYGTCWGKQVGWMYGSVAEDIPTGLNIHRKGWRSEACTPDRNAFTGCAPGGLVSTMIQQKRWASGVTVVFFGKHSPVMGMLFGKIQFRTGLSYFWLTNWGLRGPFLVCYLALIAYCIITDTNIFPKGLGLWIPVALVVVYNVHTLSENLTIGLSVRHWWNNQRMTIMTTSTAWFIGFLSGMLKLLGISDIVFEITEKDVATRGADGNNAYAGRFSFDESPVFVVGTTILLVHLTAMLIKYWDSGNECGVGELMCSTYVVVCYWPYFKGLFGRGKYGIPLSTICKSAVYRIFSPNTFTFPWLLAFICESWFTFIWIVILTAKWSPAVTITHPDRLLQRVPELPPVDLFVTTADDILEPPIITVNTVLSLLALDYPSNKLACYVSDDGCSPLTFYALLEASKFAKLWIPFCKKHNVRVRAPFRYFSKVATNRSGDSLEFKREWSRMKDIYDNLSQNIEDVTRKKIPFQLDGEFAVFRNTEQRNHPTIIKVISENKDGLSDGLPSLIYISREKRPQYPHNYKAGAMNVLTRVSGLMTNAPFLLNVDCDMFVNNPKIVLHAMCILMDSRNGKDVAFVQCFQQFYDGIKDDPFGNQWVAAFEEFAKSAACALEESAYSANDITSSSFIEAATEVANCGYEDGTCWGQQMGWMYGSVVEDIPTGLNLQRRGWRSECCTPDPIAFTGCTPGGLLSTIIQHKRWFSGHTVVTFGKHSPIMGILFGKLQFRSGLSYLWILTMGLRGPFLVCYVALLAYCIITNTVIFSKGLGLWISIALFVVYNVHTLVEYLAIGLSTRHWWNNQRMCMIRTTTASFLGFFSGLLKISGLSETAFDVTEKGHPNSSGDGNKGDAGRFTFNDSPVFVIGTTILMVHLMAMFIKFWGLYSTHIRNDCGLGELIGSTYVVACYWPYLKGLFGKDKYGIPKSEFKMRDSRHSNTVVATKHD
ncbi:hypothetical protein Fmac_019434 [Flemingia macrophylla]|uniref:Uncharacterized protein n=1 Tax=Flemingia macrophylla TaxID=520843 RepID=A0ABD1M7T6_9FABA